jgi:DNA invertase Pin-like site-specific DNA recombinase
MGVHVGYARTSTVDQAYGMQAQLERLRKEGCGRIFHEHNSSKSQIRDELERALEYIRDGDGDVLVVCKLDRLARSIHDALAIVERLREKGASLKVLDSPIDMTTPFGELLFSILAAIAQFERDLMLVRQKEGIARAKAAGKYAGQQPTAIAKTAEVLAMRAEGTSGTAIARTLGIGVRSVWRIVADDRIKNEITTLGIHPKDAAE